MPDNNFDGSQNIYNGKTRTNPWANDPNALVLLGVERFGGYFQTGFTMTVTNAGDDLAFAGTSGHQTPAPRFFKWVVRDGLGNEAYGALDTAAPATPVAVDTSGLDPQTDWHVEFNAEQDGGDRVGYYVVIPAGLPTTNPVLTVTDGKYT